MHLYYAASASSLADGQEYCFDVTLQPSALRPMPKLCNSGNLVSVRDEYNLSLA